MIVILIKYLAQILVVISGFMGVLSDKKIRTDEGTGKIRFTGLGWALVVSFSVGLVAFIVTDFKERESKSEELQQLREVVASQRARALERRIDGLRVVFLLNRADQKRIATACDELETPYNFYWLDAGVEAKRTESYWRFSFKGQMMDLQPVTTQFGWGKFTPILEAALPELTMEWEDVAVKISPSKISSVSSITFGWNWVAVELLEPDLKLSLRALTGELNFWVFVPGAPGNLASYPTSIKLVSLDPQVVLDAPLGLEWTYAKPDRQHAGNPQLNRCGPFQLRIPGL